MDSADFEEARDKLLMGVTPRRSMVMPEGPPHDGRPRVQSCASPLLPQGRRSPAQSHDHSARSGAWPRDLASRDRFLFAHARLAQDRICICYGGYVAETIVYGEATTGTKQDLQQATDIARKMVCEFGMADALGAITYGQEDEPIFIGKEIARHKDYSEDTARQIDTAIRSILDEMKQLAEKIILEHRGELDYSLPTSSFRRDARRRRDPRAPRHAERARG